MAVSVAYPGIALVTGAASGIGKATVQAFLQAGCTKMALLDINEQGLSASMKSLIQPPHENQVVLRSYSCNVADPDAVEKVFKQAKEDFGRLDYVVNCAGTLIPAPNSADSSIEDFDKQQSVTFRGLWLCSRQALRIMRQQPIDSQAYPDAGIPEHRAQRGSIVNIASTLALSGMENSQHTAYSTAKAAVLTLTRCDARDFAEQRIRVNAVLPGLINTPLAYASAEANEHLVNNVISKIPMKRCGLPEEVADVILFLSGYRASFVTGSGWVVDGGFIS